MGLVELVRGLQTSDATFQASQSLAAHLGKDTCVSADRPGFLVNRILMPSINEAFFALMEVRVCVPLRARLPPHTRPVPLACWPKHPPTPPTHPPTHPPRAGRGHAARH